MSEGLKLVVGADVKDAEKALKDFVGTAEDAGNKAGKALGSGLNKATPAIDNIQKAAKPAIKSISTLGDSLETLRAKLGAKQEFLKLAKTQNEVIVLNDGIRHLQSEIKRVQSLGQPAFNNLAGSIRTAGFSFDTIVKGANNAFGVLRRIAFILPGVGIAGLLGGITSVLGQLLFSGDEAEKSIDKVKDKVDEAAEAQKKYSEAIDKAAASVISQAADLTDLRAILAGTTKNVDSLTEATIKQGVARFVFDQKNEQLQKALFAQIQKNIQQRKINNLEADLGAISVDRETEALQLHITTLKRLGQAVPKQVTDRIAFNKQISESSVEIGKLNALGTGLDDFFDKFLDKGKKAKDNTKDIIAEAKRIAAFFDKNTQFSVSFEVDERLDDAGNKQRAIEFIQKAKTFFEKQSSEKGVFDFKPLILTEFRFKSLSEKLLSTLRQEEPKILKTFTQVQKELEKSIDDQVARNPVTINQANIEVFKQKFEKLGARFKVPIEFNLIGDPGKNLQLLNQQFANLKTAIEAANFAAATLGSAFQNTFNAILQGESPIKAFIQSIGQSIIQLISQLIAAAIKAAILKAILGTATGGIGSLVGLAAGGGGGIPGFASGGLVFGPTLSLIGEGSGTTRSNPEVVAPLDQLRGLIGSGQAVQVVVSGRLRGTDMLLQDNRTNRSNGRLGA